MNRKRQIAVGLFIFLGLMILIVTVFTLGGQHKSFVKTMTVKAIFNDVVGLQAGSNIWFSGVKIGTVKKLSFYGNSQVEVDMNIEKSVQSHIRKDAKAKIGSDGLIGNKIIVIYDGTTNAPPVAANDFLLVEKAISTDDMLAMLQNNNKNLLEITTNFKMISQKLSDGQGTLGMLLNDPSLGNDLKRTLTNFKKASLRSEDAIAKLDNFTSKLNSKGTLANDLITDTVVYNNLRGASSQLRAALYSADEFTENLKKASENLSHNNNTIGLLLNDEKTAAQLSNTIKNLESGSQKLDEDLEAVQHNFLLRGFFKKKAKNKSQ